MGRAAAAVCILSFITGCAHLSVQREQSTAYRETSGIDGLKGRVKEIINCDNHLSRYDIHGNKSYEADIGPGGAVSGECMYKNSYHGNGTISISEFYTGGVLQSITEFNTDGNCIRFKNLSDAVTGISITEISYEFKNSSFSKITEKESSFDTAGKLLSTDTTEKLYESGVCIRETRSSGGRITVSSAKIQRDSSGRIVHMSGDGGSETSYTYDEAGRTLSVHRSDHAGAYDSRTQNRYDTGGRLVERVFIDSGPYHRKTEKSMYRYNDRGLVQEETKTENGKSRTIRYTYDSRGNIIETDENGKKSCRQHISYWD